MENINSYKSTETHVQNNLIPATGFVRLPTILKVIPVSKSTWWFGVKTGRFPKSIKLCSNITVWRAEDIIELIKSNSGN